MCIAEIKQQAVLTHVLEGAAPRGGPGYPSQCSDMPCRAMAQSVVTGSILGLSM